jgi:hypothetical protein
VKTWFDSGVKIRLGLMPEARTVGSGQLDETDLIILNVTNRGDAPTMVTHMVLLEITSWWRLLFYQLTSVSWWRWRKVQPEKTYLIPNPQLKGYPPNIPSVLEPSKIWTGAIRPRPDWIPDMYTGTFYTGICTSNRDRPYLVRIPKRKDKLPEGTMALDA